MGYYGYRPGAVDTKGQSIRIEARLSRDELCDTVEVWETTARRDEEERKRKKKGSTK